MSQDRAEWKALQAAYQDPNSTAAKEGRLSAQTSGDTDPAAIQDKDNWDSWDHAAIKNLANELTSGAVHDMSLGMNTLGNGLAADFQGFNSGMQQIISAGWTGKAASAASASTLDYTDQAEEFGRAVELTGAKMSEAANAATSTKAAVPEPVAFSVREATLASIASPLAGAIDVFKQKQAQSTAHTEAVHVMNTVYTPGYVQGDTGVPTYVPPTATSAGGDPGGSDRTQQVVATPQPGDTRGGGPGAGDAYRPQSSLDPGDAGSGASGGSGGANIGPGSGGSDPGRPGVDGTVGGPGPGPGHATPGHGAPGHGDQVNGGQGVGGQHPGGQGSGGDGVPGGGGAYPSQAGVSASVSAGVGTDAADYGGAIPGGYGNTSAASAGIDPTLAANRYGTAGGYGAGSGFGSGGVGGLSSGGVGSGGFGSGGVGSGGLGAIGYGGSAGGAGYEGASFGPTGSGGAGAYGSGGGSGAGNGPLSRGATSGIGNSVSAAEAAAARGTGAAGSGARGGAGMGGMGGMGAGRGKGADDYEHDTPSYLITQEHGSEIVGELPRVSPPVIGE